MTDRVSLQLIDDSLLYASEEMGLALRNSAYSPNIKERMDHSAAVFDCRGRLLAQAEHIPVHLGSLPWGLARLLESCRMSGLDFEEGSMIAANDPYITGTHLNDVTVAAPLFHKGELTAYLVNKAHHSDVGGRHPGSISMDATTLSEEGFVLEPRYLKRKGDFVDGTVESLASKSRTPQERRGDLRAQAAANTTGLRRVESILAKYGREAFDEAAERSIERSKRLMEERISSMQRGTFRATDVVEGLDGEDLVLKTAVTVSRSRVEVDYDGTDPQVDYPLNAVLGVTISGAYFVLRCLVGSDIRANHGAFFPVGVTAPLGSVLNPTPGHPVGGGNVEVSQRNADVLFRALSRSSGTQVPAAAGGSMNNVMMGGKGWAFYETNGVGLGGKQGLDGVDGIQCNMTNTMNTPVEELERSFPIMVTRYEFRPGSGGAGTYRGGNGLVRSYKVLTGGVTVTIMADRGRHRPWGLQGGRDGSPTVVNATMKGRKSKVECKTTLHLSSGDAVELNTAGGGGFGPPRRRKDSDVRRDVENGLLAPGSAAGIYGVRAAA